MKYVVLIPAYNEERNIGWVVRDCTKFTSEVMVVDDGSVDRTSEIAAEAGAQVLRHHINKGKGAALISGFSELMDKDFDAVVTLDADGQHLTSEIHQLTDAFEGGIGDIIVGARMINRESMPFHRMMSNRVGEFFISRAIGTYLPDTQSGFRLYSREVINSIKLERAGFEMETELLIKASRAGFRIGSVPVTTVYPEHYRSHFRPVRDFYRISILVLKSLLQKRNITFCHSCPFCHSRESGNPGVNSSRNPDLSLRKHGTIQRN